MYNIYRCSGGKWRCECRIQDGTERWESSSREEAVQSMILSAKVMNGSYIREDDISFFDEAPPVKVSAGDELLEHVRRGSKVVLDHDHFLLKYRITEAEAEMIFNIRIGKLRVVSGDRS